MAEVDFSVCKFIKEQMWFFTSKDFFINRKVIKKLFDSLDENGKLFYMRYVYSNVNCKYQIKNAIWDYLNNYDNGSQLAKLIRLSKTR